LAPHFALVLVPVAAAEVHFKSAALCPAAVPCCLERWQLSINDVGIWTLHVSVGTDTVDQIQLANTCVSLLAVHAAGDSGQRHQAEAAVSPGGLPAGGAVRDAVQQENHLVPMGGQAVARQVWCCRCVGSRQSHSNYK
jgi:hypothetical protein